MPEIMRRKEGEEEEKEEIGGERAAHLIPRGCLNIRETLLVSYIVTDEETVDPRIPIAELKERGR